jgi:AraC-like DNA-binding protein
MDMSKVIWVDLRFIRDQASSYYCLSRDWEISYISDSNRIDREIRKAAPIFLCFEYDYPDISGLMSLQQARRLFPSLPIIMLTEQHSEVLAIWALRIRVWDYFVKPLQPKDLVTSATAILSQTTLAKDETAKPYQPANLWSTIPTGVRTRICKKTFPAQSFVETHYHEKIYEEKVAQLCGMNTSTFSRSFKKEQGMTFRDYLINYRISKARELLQKPYAVVTAIAYTVGFQDPSYFTRIFRRIVGMSPSRYHETNKI